MLEQNFSPLHKNIKDILIPSLTINQLGQLALINSWDCFDIFQLADMCNGKPLAITTYYTIKQLGLMQVKINIYYYKKYDLLLWVTFSDPRYMVIVDEIVSVYLTVVLTNSLAIFFRGREEGRKILSYVIEINKNY